MMIDAKCNQRFICLIKRWLFYWNISTCFKYAISFAFYFTLFCILFRQFVFCKQKLFDLNIVENK